MSNRLEFPVFLHGPFPSLHRKVLKEAGKWAKTYRADKTFPEPETLPVPAGSIIYTSDITDVDRAGDQWRSYFVTRLCNAVCNELEWRDSREVVSQFEAHIIDTPWGALDFALTHYSPNSIERVSKRIKSLLHFWPLLGELLFIGPAGLNPTPLTDLVTFHYTSLLAMWLDEKSADLKTQLDTAISIMNAATPEEKHSRIVKMLTRMASKEETLKNNSRLQDPEWLSEQLSHFESERIEDMETGLTSRLLGALYDLNEKT